MFILKAVRFWNFHLTKHAAEMLQKFAAIYSNIVIAVIGTVLVYAIKHTINTYVYSSHRGRNITQRTHVTQRNKHHTEEQTLHREHTSHTLDRGTDITQRNRHYTEEQTSHRRNTHQTEKQTSHREIHTTQRSTHHHKHIILFSYTIIIVIIMCHHLVILYTIQ